MRKSFAACSLVLAMASCGLFSSGCAAADDAGTATSTERRRRPGSGTSVTGDDDGKVTSTAPSSEGERPREEAGGDGDDEVTSADDSAPPKPDPPAEGVTVGSKLRTTADLNLRAGSSTDDQILLVMPEGSIVTVRQAAPVNAFYAVKYGSTDGWAHGSYLTPDKGEAPPNPGNPTTVDIGGPAVRAHVQSFANAACSQVGCPHELGTYNGHDPSADRALDMMMAKGGTKPNDGGAHGTKVATFALDNSDTYKVMYVIWYQRINTLDGRGWRAMADRGSITQNHYDHVHVSFDP